MDQRLVVEKRRYESTPDTHIHLFSQLLLPLAGTLTIHAEMENHLLDENDIFYIPCKCPHTFYSNGRNEFVVLDIPDSMLGHVQKQFRGCTSHSLDKKWKAIRFLVLDALNQDASESCSIRDLFPYIARQLCGGLRPPSVQYIHDHFDEDVKLEHLASLENYSFSYFSQWFRRETGKTPSAYLREIRLQHAQRLPQDTSLSIGSIAREVGLQHQASLTRLFQKHLGTMPAGYRKTVVLDKNVDGSGKSEP